MSLFISNKIEIIENYAEGVIRTVTKTFKIPAVVRLIKARHRTRSSYKLNKTNLYARDLGRCQYCRMAVSKRDGTYDHVTPRSKGGQTVWENIVLACSDCNAKKGSKSLEESGMKLLTKPVRPKNLHKDIPDEWRFWIPSII